MHQNPLTVSVGANLVEAIEIIFEYKLTGLTVVDESGQVAGILSELDCIKGVLNAIYNEGDPEHALVRDAMCTEVVSCAPGDNIVEVAQAMLDSHQRRPLPAPPSGALPTGCGRASSRPRCAN